MADGFSDKNCASGRANQRSLIPDPEEQQPVSPALSSAEAAANGTDDQEHLQALVEERVSAVLRKLLRLEMSDLSG